MREVKFRAWNKVSNEWLRAGQGLLGHIVAWETDERFALLGRGDFEIVQFTGLHDKNGKEIYEGDIVNSTDITGLHKYGKDIIEFKNGGFVLVNTDADIDDAWIGDDDFDELEVIGNIYENPELLEVTT